MAVRKGTRWCKLRYALVIWLSGILCVLSYSDEIPNGPSPPASPTAPKRLLIVSQGPDGHPPTTHEFLAGAKVLAELLKPHKDVRITMANADEPWADGPTMIDKADGIVMFVTQGARWMQMTPERHAALKRLAARGGAIVALHWSVGAIDAQYIQGQLELLGATRGGPQRKYREMAVELKRVVPGHPILRGVADIRAFDEMYYRLDRVSGMQPLLTARIDDNDETAAWCWERPDGGRAFGFVGLHFHSNWQLPAYRRFVTQGVLWSLKLPIPSGGVSTDIESKMLQLDGLLPPPVGPAVENKVPGAQAAAPAAASPDTLLLKDYRPSSIYNIPKTSVKRARFPVVDVHSHVYAKTPERVDQWVRVMEEVGIQKTVIMVSAAGKAFDDALVLYKKYPDRFEMWCGLDLSGIDKPDFDSRAIAELERCKRAGAVGVGELSDKGRGLGFASNRTAVPMHIDDPRMDPILEKCAALGLPVNIHVGEDRWMYDPMDATNDGLMNSFIWRVPNEPSVLRHNEVVATLERAVKRHPRTTVIACHFANCCSDLSILARMLDSCPNLYADIGARYGETAPIPRYMARFFDKYQDRLLYGTDMGFNPEMYRTTFRILETEDEHFYATDLFGYHWPLHGFGLKDRVLKKVYGDNARRILKQVRTSELTTKQ